MQDTSTHPLPEHGFEKASSGPGPATAFESSFSGRRVLLTGHTGFKGAWLAEWLLTLGARVTGLSLPAPTSPSLFDQLGLAHRLDHRVGDITDIETVRRTVAEVQPDMVFHLAAQAIVRTSFEMPVQTYAANVMGTVILLDALRTLNRPCAAVFVTSDKCYENREWLQAYREEDPMGGYDPYSSSKGCAELVISSFRRSFFNPRREPKVAVASGRAGNVIGGGDWATDRIVPDCIRSLSRGESVVVRNSGATRPWQHVLEPLGGYLLLASRLYRLISGNCQTGALEALASPFNFGPNIDSHRPVSELVAEILRHWPGTCVNRPNPNAPHEAGLLNLAHDKAFHLLGWKPRWDFADTIRETVQWYRQTEARPGSDEIRAATVRQIEAFANAALTIPGSGGSPGQTLPVADALSK